MAGAERKKRVGRTIGQGTFAEVKFAVDADTGAAVAMKVLDKAAILNHRMLHQHTVPKWNRPSSQTCGTPNYVAPERITIKEIRADTWFKKNYVAVRCGEDGNVNLDDVQAIFDNIEDKYVSEQMTHNDGGPLMMNAFEMIILSQGLDLSALFDRQQEYVKCQTRFVSRKPAKTVVATIEVVSESMGLKVHSQNYELRLEGVSLNRMSPFAVVLEVFEVAPSLFMVDVQKVAGDTGIPQVLQELMQQIGQHNLEANRGFCKIYIAEDDHLQASY